MSRRRRLGADAQRPGRWSRRRVVVIGSGILALVALGIAVPRIASGSGSAETRSSAALTTATVQRTDLAETTPVSGVVGFAGPDGGGPQPIVQPAGTPPSAVAEQRQAVAVAEQALAADRQAADDADAADAQAIAGADQALAAAQAQRAAVFDADADPAQGTADQAAADPAQAAVAAAAVDAARARLASAQLTATQGADQRRAKRVADELALAGAEARLAAVRASQAAFEATSRYTALPVAGQVVQPGQALWSIDGRPVALLPGSLTPWRAFADGMPAGPDVAALDQALIDLGHGGGLRVSNDFTDATAAAIGRLQAAVGLPRTGALPLGAVAFAPSAVRIAAVHVPLGGPVAGGAAVVDVTSTTPIVAVALPVEQSYLVGVGDPVSVTLPDQTTSAGTISAVGSVATTAAPADGGSGGPAAGAPPKATVGVTVTLATADGAATLDQAPVTVNITSATVAHVLAVPTTALVALGGSGYAVEVVDGDRPHRLVPVTVGIFDDQAGLVQVSGQGLAVGQRVVAPA